MRFIQWLRAGVAAVAALASVTVNAQEDFVPGRLLIKFKAGVLESRSRAVLSNLNSHASGSLPRTGVKIVELPASANERSYASAFRNRPEVEFAELDGIVHLSSVPNDPLLSNEWHLNKLQTSQAWDTTAGSGSVIIGILDSGTDGSHPDLAGRMVPGWNFFDNNADTSDVIGHGTQTAGCAAASINNGLGVAGVAGNCMIMPLRVTSSTGSATFSAIASAITYAADHGCRVVSASLAMVNSSTIDSAAQYLMGKGGLYFMASGNSSSYSGGANSSPVLTVGATDQNDLRASFSTYGPWVDLAAPGVNIYTTSRGGGYSWFGGTSAATPVAAGVGALIFAANPNLSALQAIQILTSSVDDLGALGRDDYYGWGRVNAYKAVQAALTTSGTDMNPPTVSLSAPVDGETLSGVRNLFATAYDDVALDRVEFYVNGALKATVFSPPFSWAWDTYSAANGSYALKAVAKDMAGNTAESAKSVSVYNAPDTAPPSVSITSPSSGASVGAKLNVSVSAIDNRAVTRVELWLDGKLAATDSSSPWSFSLQTRKWAPGAHNLVAKAFDAAGNSASSAGVTVNK